MGAIYSVLFLLLEDLQPCNTQVVAVEEYSENSTNILTEQYPSQQRAYGLGEEQAVFGSDFPSGNAFSISQLASFKLTSSSAWVYISPAFHVSIIVHAEANKITAVIRLQR